MSYSRAETLKFHGISSEDGLLVVSFFFLK
jgi:hypothetical protein